MRRVAQTFHRADADLQMAADLGLVEVGGHAGQLQLAMQGLVADTQSSVP